MVPALEKSRPWRGLGQLVDHGQFGDLVALVPQSQHANECGQFAVDGSGRHVCLQAILHMLLRQRPFETRDAPAGEKRLKRLESRVRFRQAARARRLIMETQIARQFVIGDAVHAGQRLQACRAASFAVFQKPFRLFLFGRPGALPDRPARAII